MDIALLRLGGMPPLVGFVSHGKCSLLAGAAYVYFGNGRLPRRPLFFNIQRLEIGDLVNHKEFYNNLRATSDLLTLDLRTKSIIFH
jgi:hypothetical protein